MKSGRAGEQSLAPFALYVGLIERPTRHRGSHMPRRYVYNGNICVMHVEQRQGAEPSHVFSTAPMRNNVTAPASFETDDHDEMVAWLKKNARGALWGALRADLVHVMLAAEPDQQFDVFDVHDIR